MEERITLDGDDIKVEKFSYLGDVLRTEGGVHEAVTSRIRYAWKNFLQKRHLTNNQASLVQMIS